MIAWESKEEMVKAFEAFGDGENSFKEDFEVISKHIEGTITKAVLLCTIMPSSNNQDNGEHETPEFMELLIKGKPLIFSGKSVDNEDTYSLYNIEENSYVDFDKKDYCFRKYILIDTIPGLSAIITIETERKSK